MKRIIIALFMCLTSLVYSQDYSLKDGYFYTVYESGIKAKVNVKFAISQETVDTLMKHPLFLKWESDIYNNPNDSVFIRKHKNHTHFETFLYTRTGGASVWARLDIKSMDSYTPIESSEGSIRIDEMGFIAVVHHFQAQNGYGNMVYCKAFYLSGWVDGKEQTTHFVR
jgi:hypothetical protein